MGTMDRGSGENEMGDNLPAVEMGLGGDLLLLALGYSYACAASSGGAKCWGLNDAGQLGYGDTERRGNEPGEMGDDLPFLLLTPTPTSNTQGWWLVLGFGVCLVISGCVVCFLCVGWRMAFASNSKQAQLSEGTDMQASS